MKRPLVDVIVIDDDDEEDAVEYYSKRIKLEKESSTHITQLPTEIAHEIFSYCPFHFILNNVALVNHQFKDLVLGNDTTTSIFWDLFFKYQSFPLQYNDSCISFVRRYQPKNMNLICKEISTKKYESQIHINGTNVDHSGVRLLVEIEPFVTKLIFTGGQQTMYERLLELAKRELPNYRQLFPNLISFLSSISSDMADYCFGPDLSRFKELELENLCDSCEL
jgi:hypothetical protein